jgi:hypothetical protein
MPVYEHNCALLEAELDLELEVYLLRSLLQQVDAAWQGVEVLRLEGISTLDLHDLMEQVHLAAEGK